MDADMSRIIPPPEHGEPMKRQSVDLPTRLWEEIEQAAEQESSRRAAMKPPPRETHVSKARMLQWLVEFALREYRAEQKGGKSRQ